MFDLSIYISFTFFNDGLKEDLEALIATKLRAAMAAKSPAAEIETLVAEAKTKLAIAKGLLR
jgi:hypothetical protein